MFGLSVHRGVLISSFTAWDSQEMKQAIYSTLFLGVHQLAALPSGVIQRNTRKSKNTSVSDWSL